MARYDHLPVFKLAYALTLDLYRLTHDFPREHKYELGQDIKREANAFLLSIISANAAVEKEESIGVCESMLEKVRLLLRIAYDLKLFSKEIARTLRAQFIELGTQLAGWKKWALGTRVAH